MAVQYKKNSKRSSKTGSGSLSPIAFLVIGIIAVISFLSEYIIYIILGTTVLLVIYAIIHGSHNANDVSPETTAIYMSHDTRELEIDARCEERQAKENERKKQCDSFTVNDMQQFPDIPIAWSYVMELQHTNGVAWCQLNWNNQKIVLQYISQINDIIVDSQEYVDGIGNAHIDLNSIDFDYPVPMYKDCMCETRIECFPYTATGKLSKYPVVIPFATKFDSDGIRTIGEIKILRDGNIGSATVKIRGITFKIGLHGRSLILKRVDSSGYSGNTNLFKFTEAYE